MKDMTNKEAIEWIKAHHDFEMDCQDSQAMRHAINALENSSWIPVSERLPDKDGHYLITTDFGDVRIDYFDEECFIHYLGNVDAWMPLPQPYTKEEQDEKS